MDLNITRDRLWMFLVRLIGAKDHTLGDLIEPMVQQRTERLY